MTIRELADELGISKQAVMKRIDTLGCRDELMRIGGQYQLDNALAETIRMYSMVVDRQPPTTNQVVDRQPPTTNQVVDRQPPTTNQPTTNHQPSCRSPTTNHQPSCRSPTDNIQVG